MAIFFNHNFSFFHIMMEKNVLNQPNCKVTIAFSLDNDAVMFTVQLSVEIFEVEYCRGAMAQIFQ